MNNDYFKLISTYELIMTLSDVERPVRIEVFRALSGENLYRARVWVQNTYNLYPTFLNTGKQGEDLQQVHSSDQLDMDITSLIAQDPDLITGKQYESEEEFLVYVKSRVMHYQEQIK